MAEIAKTEEGEERVAGKQILFFFLLVFQSVLIGFATGLICTLVLKYLRFVTHSPIAECSLMLCSGALSYYISETTHNSGIVSILGTSLMLSHYAWYNLSP
jgi:sodium/hydrogen exchanger-like protein 6/7